MTGVKKDTTQKLITATMAVVAVAIFIVAKENSGKSNEKLRAQILSASHDNISMTSDELSYEEYLSLHEDTGASIGCEYVLEGDEYSNSTLEELVDLTDGNILTGDTGSITYEFDVQNAGFYNIEIEYYPSADEENNIVRNVYINGEIPFDEASGLVFERRWIDENKDFLMVSDSNQASPDQVQDPAWMIKKFEDAEKTVNGPFLFYLEKGINEVTIESSKSSMGISYVKLVGATNLPTYEEYLANYIESGVAVIDASEIDGGYITVQGEDTEYKSSSTLLAQNNRTSVLTVPYDASNIVLNTIGGSAWNAAGTSITWTIDVPKTGLYKIAARFLQAENRDFYSVRELKINGEEPFEEAGNLKFYYDNKFQVSYLDDGSGDGYYFYFEEGENEISLTVAMGDLSFAKEQTQISVKNFNSLYHRLTAVMGSDPDEYRDYDIVSSVPDMVEILENEYYRLSLVMDDLGESIDNSSKTRELARLMLQIEELVDNPDKISKQLSTFNDNITALSEWTLGLDKQPLEIDYIMLCADGAQLPRAEGTIFQNFVHAICAFIGSFTNDYKVSTSDSTQKEKTIEVWIATSTRDQYDILQRMINTDFADKDFNVELKMVSADTVMPATLTGNGPDVAIQLNYSMPTNFAYRNAGYDLTQFDDFEEVASRFTDSAMEYFEYEGGYYALPDEMSYPVMFYRKDILDEMGLDVPQTWDELEALLPYLQADNMSVFFQTTDYKVLGGASSTTTKQINPVFASLLYQNGEELYNAEGTASNLDSLSSLLTFKKWTEYYTKEAFSVTISVVTRFRTGEVPIMIEDYTYINDILAAAPEIDGQWSIAAIPGTVLEDGTIDRSVAVNVGGSMILKNIVEANDTADEAWEFLKWWTSEDVQLIYAKEQKTILGDAATYPVANVEAIKELADDAGFLDAIETTLLWSRGIPQVPGGYISGRYVENAFLTVVDDNTDPVDTMYNLVRYINQEITNKREEFGLD